MVPVSIRNWVLTITFDNTQYNHFFIIGVFFILKKKNFNKYTQHLGELITAVMDWLHPLDFRNYIVNVFNVLHISSITYRTIYQNSITWRIKMINSLNWLLIRFVLSSLISHDDCIYMPIYINNRKTLAHFFATSLLSVTGQQC